MSQHHHSLLSSSEALLRRLADLRAEGCTIIIITHYIADALLLADDLTVLRDGQLVGSYPAASLTEAEVVRMMIGREISSLYPARRGTQQSNGVVGLDASGCSQREPGSAEFRLRTNAGEAVGLYGLVERGSHGITSVPFRARSRRSGTIQIAGRTLPAKHDVQTAMCAGLALLPEDRIADGLFLRRRIR